MRLAKVENYRNDQKIVHLDLKKVFKVDKRVVITTDKDKVKLVYQVEAIVRKSMEYRQYIQFLKENVDMTQCSFFENVTNKGKRVSIQIHHEPFTLFDISNIVLNKFITEDYELEPLMIAEEVMELHYRDMVGLIPLAVTPHQMVHDGKLFIPLQNVYGDFTKFISEYSKYFGPKNDNQYDNMLRMKLDMSKDIANLDLSVLETKYTYITVDGFTLPQPLDLKGA